MRHIGPTDRCIATIAPLRAICIVTNALNETLVIIAISYRVISHSIYGDSWKARGASFFIDSTEKTDGPAIFTTVISESEGIDDTVPKETTERSFLFIRLLAT